MTEVCSQLEVRHVLLYLNVLIAALQILLRLQTANNYFFLHSATINCRAWAWEWKITQSSDQAVWSGAHTSNLKIHMISICGGVRDRWKKLFLNSLDPVPMILPVFYKLQINNSLNGKSWNALENPSVHLGFTHRTTLPYQWTFDCDKWKLP